MNLLIVPTHLLMKKIYHLLLTAYFSDDWSSLCVMEDTDVSWKIALLQYFIFYIESNKWY